MIVVPNRSSSFWREIRCSVRAYSCDVAQSLLSHNALHVVRENAHADSRPATKRPSRFNQPFLRSFQVQPRTGSDNPVRAKVAGNVTVAYSFSATNWQVVPC